MTFAVDCHVMDGVVLEYLVFRGVQPSLVESTRAELHFLKSATCPEKSSLVKIAVWALHTALRPSSAGVSPRALSTCTGWPAEGSKEDTGRESDGPESANRDESQCSAGSGTNTDDATAIATGHVDSTRSSTEEEDGETQELLEGASAAKLLLGSSPARGTLVSVAGALLRVGYTKRTTVKELRSQFETGGPAPRHQTSGKALTSGFSQTSAGLGGDLAEAIPPELSAVLKAEADLLRNGIETCRQTAERFDKAGASLRSQCAVLAATPVGVTAGNSSAPTEEIYRLMDCLRDATAAVSAVSVCMKPLLELIRVGWKMTLRDMPLGEHELEAFFSERFTPVDGCLMTMCAWNGVPKGMMLRRVNEGIVPAGTLVTHLFEEHSAVRLHPGDVLTFAWRVPSGVVEQLRELVEVLTFALESVKLGSSGNFSVALLPSPRGSSEGSGRLKSGEVDRCVVSARQAGLRWSEEFAAFKGGMYQQFKEAARLYEEEAHAQACRMEGATLRLDAAVRGVQEQAVLSKEEEEEPAAQEREKVRKDLKGQSTQQEQQAAISEPGAVHASSPSVVDIALKPSAAGLPLPQDAERPEVLPSVPEKTPVSEEDRLARAFFLWRRRAKQKAPPWSEGIRREALRDMFTVYTCGTADCAAVQELRNTLTVFDMTPPDGDEFLLEPIQSERRGIAELEDFEIFVEAQMRSTFQLFLDPSMPEQDSITPALLGAVSERFAGQQGEPVSVAELSTMLHFLDGRDGVDGTVNWTKFERLALMRPQAFSESLGPGIWNRLGIW